MTRRIRVLIYEGDDEWLEATLSRSLRGRHVFGNGHTIVSEEVQGTLSADSALHRAEMLLESPEVGKWPAQFHQVDDGNFKCRGCGKKSEVLRRWLCETCIMRGLGQ